MPFIPLGAPIPANVRMDVRPVTAVQSSFVVASRDFFRETGRFEAYAAHLAKGARDALDSTPTGVWIPLETARAHVAASDALDLPEDEEVELGRRIAVRLHNPLIRMALRLAGAARATPMLLAAKAVKVWPERNDGGALLIIHTTPTTARVELLGYTLAESRHARRVWRGVLEANARLVLEGARVIELGHERGPLRVVYSMTW